MDKEIEYKETHNNTILESLSATEYKAKYDAAAKELLSEKVFLALIMKSCVDEYKNCGLEEIMGLIEEPPGRGGIPVLRGIPPRITGSDTVDKTLDEGTYMFDIKFHAALPEQMAEEIRADSKRGRNRTARRALGVIINIEPHGRHAPGYPLNTRMEFYLARMLSKEYGEVFTGEDFDKIEKVYSIWIVMDAPKYCANTVMVYKTAEESLMGVGKGEAVEEFHTDPSTYQIMTGVVIRLGDLKSAEENRNELLRVLGTVLSNKASKEEKIRILRVCGIPVTGMVERKVADMGSLGDLIEEKGKIEGKIEGMQEAMVNAIKNVMESFGVPLEKAMDSLKIPQNMRASYASRLES